MRLRHKTWPSAEVTMTTNPSITQLAAGLLQQHRSATSFKVRLDSPNDQTLLATELERMGCRIEAEPGTGGFTAYVPKEMHQG